MQKPSGDIWEQIKAAGLLDAFAPSYARWAFGAYAEAVQVCEERGRSYSDIRVEVSCYQQTGQPRIIFDGKTWTVGVGFNKMRPAEGLSYLEEAEGYFEEGTDPHQIILRNVIFFGRGDTEMLAKNNYYCAYLQGDGTWKKISFDNINRASDRWRQLTDMKPPPRGIRLTMDAFHQDGTPYEHVIAEYAKTEFVKK